MKAIKITRAELEEFKKLQEKERWDWPSKSSGEAELEMSGRGDDEWEALLDISAEYL